VNTIPAPTWHAKYPSTEEIMASKIQAKAVIRKQDGKILIVAIFQLSYYYKFFFIFAANAPRSPRRSWRLRNYHLIHESRTFEQIAARYGAEQIGKIKFYAGKKNIEAFMDRTANPFRGYDPTAPKQLPAGQTNSRYQRKTAAQRAGRTLYLSNE
jgi:hypothetical protein